MMVQQPSVTGFVMCYKPYNHLYALAWAPSVYNEKHLQPFSTHFRMGLMNRIFLFTGNGNPICFFLEVHMMHSVLKGKSTFLSCLHLCPYPGLLLGLNFMMTNTKTPFFLFMNSTPVLKDFCGRQEMVNFGLYNFLLKVAVYIDTCSWLYVGFLEEKIIAFFRLWKTTFY